MKEKLLELWKEEYGFEVALKSGYWLKYKEDWLLLLRLPSSSLQSDLFFHSRGTSVLHPFTSILHYAPFSYEVPGADHRSRPPIALQLRMNLRFEQGISLGEQLFYD